MHLFHNLTISNEFALNGIHRNIISGYSSAVHQKGWVQETIDDHKIIIKNNNLTAHLEKQRNFGNKITMTFVTPWNKKGYKWTELYAHKFTHISPVWFDIQPLPGSSITSFMITGGDNVDTKWIKEVRSNNPRIQIVPRYTLTNEHWKPEYIDKFLRSKSMQKEFGKVLIQSIKNKDAEYNGCVLEMTPFFNFFAHVERQVNDKQIPKKQLLKTRRKWIKWIESMSKRLRKSKRYIYLVLSPYHVKLVNFNILCKYVKGTIIMTYDYSVNQGKQGAIAPLNWMQGIVESVNSKLSAKYEWKVLLGLNFYGYKYTNSGTDVMIGDELIELLKKYGDDYEWKWDADVFEHYLANKKDDSIKTYYPTLKSVATRIEFASMYKIGISIWELGQGMEYFTDLL